MEERSHISASGANFVNQLVREICLNGSSLSKFSGEIKKFFPNDSDIYGQIEEFVEAVKSVKRGETEVDASFLELRTLAQHIYLTSDTVNAVVEPLKSMIRKPEPAPVKQGSATTSTPRTKVEQPSKKGTSKAKLYLILFLIVVVVLLILYFNSK